MEELCISPQANTRVDRASYFSLLSHFKCESLWLKDEIPRPPSRCKTPLVTPAKPEKTFTIPFLSIREQLWYERKGRGDMKDPAGESLLPPHGC